MRDATDHPPHDDGYGDLGVVVTAGRRKVRRRRAGVVAGTALTAGAIAVASVAGLDPAPADLAAAGVPRAEGLVIGLPDARQGLEGSDYRNLASYTNKEPTPTTASTSTA
jgi:hypothetical protein